MRRRPVSAVCLALVATLLALPAGAAGVDFDRFARDTAAFCASNPSTACVGRTFAALDTDQSGDLSPDEIGRAHADLAAWSANVGPELPPDARRGLGLALQTIDLIGVERAIYLYDGDHDGRLTLEEATQDLRLDNRPIGAIYQEGTLIDWRRVRAALGPTAFLLDYLGLY